ncbi:PQQ-binding-like beta-propeller repeat protein [Sulfobacillus thermosulfidooxidans]|uniref:outer membrane protein assembly factor BamB family protein n=1 Tax=Sulfobacillus thermosulfidooxidans TaxID=28034 RepID=UPI0006B48A23|nr:PQQ-binding-like beta-propeller repeat protein [Sulfobacillus thermosulfidooxidans]
MIQKGRWGIGIMAVIIASGVGYAIAQAQKAPPVPTTNVGPQSFTKYAMNASNNAVYETATVKNWTANWTFTAKEPLQQASIANGIIYISGDGGNLAYRHNDLIYAVDAQNGQKLWATHLNNMSMTTPVVAQGMVFVGSGTQGFNPKEQALVNHLHTRHIIRGTGPNAIYALNSHTGQVIWKYNTPGENMPTFVYHQGTLYVANGNGKVYAFNAKSGTLLWTVNIGSYVSMSSPVLDGDLLYISGAHPYALYAVNIKTHQIQWKTPVPAVFAGSDDCSLALWHHRIFLEGTAGTWQHPRSVFFAFDNQDGRLLWKRRLGGGLLPTNIEVSAPVVNQGTVFIGSPITHKEYAFNARTGHLDWSFKAAAPIAESPAIFDHRLFVGDTMGMFYVLNSHTGQEIAARYLAGAFAADYPLIVGKTLYQPNQNGQMLAIPINTLMDSKKNAFASLPVPAGVMGADILQGEKIFMSPRLSSRGLTCNSCHVDQGTTTTYMKGHIIPTLIGAVSAFPLVRNGHVRTLDGQINHCITAMGAKKLSSSSRTIKYLNLYLHWLSSGFSNRLTPPAGHQTITGGCN